MCAVGKVHKIYCNQMNKEHQPSKATASCLDSPNSFIITLRALGSFPWGNSPSFSGLSGLEHVLRPILSGIFPGPPTTDKFQAVVGLSTFVGLGVLYAQAHILMAIWILILLYYNSCY